MEISAAAVICAAGTSSRMGGIKKEYQVFSVPTDQSPLSVLGATAKAFILNPAINPLIIVVPRGTEEAAREGLPEKLASGRVFFVQGGPTRRSSVHRALSFLETTGSMVSHVLIHDGARPWIKGNLIDRIIRAAAEYGAAIPALPLVETPKELGSEFGSESGPLFIQRHLRRSQVCSAQTPQAFRFPEILRAHEKAAEKEEKENFEYTDDAEVWGEFIGKVAVIAGDPQNKKITYPGDLE
jgi:2-C-methyl-D-erythritol 4-phosphate cytidylyltransferase